MSRDGSVRTHVIDAPGDREFDAIRVVPRGGDSVYHLGHVRVLPEN